MREEELKDTNVLVVDLNNKKLIDLREDRKPEIPKKQFNELRSRMRAAQKNKNDVCELSKVWEEFIESYLQPMRDLCKEPEDGSKSRCRYSRPPNTTPPFTARHTDKSRSSRYRDIGNLAVAIKISGK